MSRRVRSRSLSTRRSPGSTASYRSNARRSPAERTPNTARSSRSSSMGRRSLDNTPRTDSVTASGRTTPPRSSGATNRTPNCPICNPCRSRRWRAMPKDADHCRCWPARPPDGCGYPAPTARTCRASPSRSVELAGVRIALGPTAAGIEGFRRSHFDAITTQRMVARMGSTQRVVNFTDVELIALITAHSRAGGPVHQTHAR